MSGHRQAAVALHALADADRAAILAELPDADQHTLRGYLAELDELGFDRDVMASASTVPAAARAPAEPHARLHSASAQAMFSIFDGEPASLIAQFLNLRAWPWASDMLLLFPQSKRELIRAARAQHDVAAPARTRFLLDVIGNRLEDLGAPAVAPRWQTGIGAIRATMASWTR